MPNYFSSIGSNEKTITPITGWTFTLDGMFGEAQSPININSNATTYGEIVFTSLLMICPSFGQSVINVGSVETENNAKTIISKKKRKEVHLQR